MAIHKVKKDFKIRQPLCLSDLKAATLSKQDSSICVEESSYQFFQSLEDTHEYGIGRDSSSLLDDLAAKVAGDGAIAVVFSGGPAPGGHDVVAGIWDALADLGHEQPKLCGFIGGPSGILNNDHVWLTKNKIDAIRHTGGFNLLATGRTKFKSKDDFEKCAQVLLANKCSSLIVIGGDDSNTNAAFLADYFKSNSYPLTVVGVPKTIDGDLCNERVQTSFGFHTATQTYAQLVSNISRDAISSRKYYHFVRLMGRAASHVTLETALLTKPNLTLISEEIAQEKTTLSQIAENIAELVIQRSHNKKNHGVILVPEGLIEHIDEIKVLIRELNTLLHHDSKYIKTLQSFTRQSQFVNSKLSKDASYTFSSLPNLIQRQLLLDRDSHGNVQLSRIETEKLIAELVGVILRQKKISGKYKGSFSHLSHFFGYEGRCGTPSEFDCCYSYALGKTALFLAQNNKSGYLAYVTDLQKDVLQWKAGGICLPSMMAVEKRGAHQSAVIQKKLVDVDGPVFHYFKNVRDAYLLEDCYEFVPPIQWQDGHSATAPLILRLEAGIVDTQVNEESKT